MNLFSPKLDEIQISILLLFLLALIVVYIRGKLIQSEIKRRELWLRYTKFNFDFGIKFTNLIREPIVASFLGSCMTCSVKNGALVSTDPRMRCLLYFFELPSRLEYSFLTHEIQKLNHSINLKGTSLSAFMLSSFIAAIKNAQEKYPEFVSIVFISNNEKLDSFICQHYSALIES